MTLILLMQISDAENHHYASAASPAVMKGYEDDDDLDDHDFASPAF